MIITRSSITGIGATSAEYVSYDNAYSGLSAEDVQAALDEIAGGVETYKQKDLTDNNTDYLILCDHTVFRASQLQYTLETSTTYQEGVFIAQHNGSTVELDHAFNFKDPEITGITFSSDLSGGNMRLVIVTLAVGENPKMMYRITNIRIPT